MNYDEMMTMIGQGQDTGNLQDQIKVQMERAAALREGNAPQMRQAGRVSVAPNIMELLGGLARENTAQQMQKSAQTGMQDVRAKQQMQYAALLRAMAQGGQPPQQPQMPAPQQPQMPPQMPPQQPPNQFYPEG